MPEKVMDYKTKKLLFKGAFFTINRNCYLFVSGLKSTFRLRSTKSAKSLK